MRWPFSRKEDAPAADVDATPPVTLPPRRTEWSTLPPIQRSIGPAPLTAAPAFQEELASHPPTPALQPLGHHVSAQAPAGLVLSVNAPQASLTGGPAMVHRPRLQRKASAEMIEPESEPPTVPAQAPEPAVSAEPIPLQRLTRVEASPVLQPIASSAILVSAGPPSSHPLTQGELAVSRSTDSADSSLPSARRLTLGQARRIGLGAPIVPQVAQRADREAGSSASLPAPPSQAIAEGQPAPTAEPSRPIGLPTSGLSPVGRVLLPLARPVQRTAEVAADESGHGPDAIFDQHSPEGSPRHAPLDEAVSLPLAGRAGEGVVEPLARAAATDPDAFTALEMPLATHTRRDSGPVRPAFDGVPPAVQGTPEALSLPPAESASRRLSLPFAARHGEGVDETVTDAVPSPMPVVIAPLHDASSIPLAFAPRAGGPADSIDSSTPAIGLPPQRASATLVRAQRETSATLPAQRLALESRTGPAPVIPGLRRSDRAADAAASGAIEMPLISHRYGDAASRSAPDRDGPDPVRTVQRNMSVALDLPLAIAARPKSAPDVTVARQVQDQIIASGLATRAADGGLVFQPPADAADSPAPAVQRQPQAAEGPGAAPSSAAGGAPAPGPAAAAAPSVHQVVDEVYRLLKRELLIQRERAGAFHDDTA